MNVSLVGLEEYHNLFEGCIASNWSASIGWFRWKIGHGIHLWSNVSSQGKIQKAFNIV